ncbi:VWA domain-containing protein [Ancylobacter defluvii]|uniref:Transporter n=1 Tax=Ancylobacter defluvii TaxID=1282440 RepID=A0A9W6JXV5_9HYPH|nr:VWA domain-containing protein [Ancylobacter defluvii]MBS7586588.1 VWA domain-containing protein [Ancylobacter defluvii]GLK85876.1 transporter [Ancylobacter defluvii]
MMDGLAQLHFLRPWWLLLVLPALGLWWLGRREADTTARWRRAIDPALLRHLIIGGDARRWLNPENLLLAAWIVGILAVAGPTWRQLPSPFAQAARPAMFVVKVTPSMLERDLAPTRLDRARQKMADLLKLREGAPTGLVAYAGSAHLVLPPTPDAAVVGTMAAALAPDLMPRQGDALADAVTLASDALRRGGQGGSVLVFADAAPALDDGAAAAPVTLYALHPPGRDADPSIAVAAAALHADVVDLTLDDGDVGDLAHILATAGPPPPAPGEGVQWEEAGYWLTPLLALLALLWFRRGWVLA